MLDGSSSSTCTANFTWNWILYPILHPYRGNCCTQLSYFLLLYTKNYNCCVSVGMSEAIVSLKRSTLDGLRLLSNCGSKIKVFSLHYTMFYRVMASHLGRGICNKVSFANGKLMQNYNDNRNLIQVRCFFGLMK